MIPRNTYTTAAAAAIMSAAVLFPITSAAYGRKTVKILGGSVAIANVTAKKSGGQMRVGMDIVLDSLPMTANRRIVLTPVLHGQGDSIMLKPVVVNSRRQQIVYDRSDHRRYDGASPLVVQHRTGQHHTVAYSASADYAQWMRSAQLRMSEDLCGCGDTESGRTELLHTFATPQCAYVAPVAAATKTYQIHGRAYIDFPVNRTELHPDYRNNPRELAKIVDTIDVIKRDTLMTITRIDIHGYASPESPYAHNAWLAEHRAATLKDYVRQLVSLDDSLFTVHYTPEDWDGLRRFIADSNIDHRDSILAIANDEATEPDRRELAIKTRYPEQYRLMLAAWYPALRHSDYTITCSVRPFTIEEARRVFRTRPQLLSANELFRLAQTCEPGSEEFREIMETAVRLFPDDPTANLNAAVARLNAGNAAAAKPYLDKAGDSPEARAARHAYDELTAEEQ